MGKALTAAENLARARAAIKEAEKTLKELPPSGRARTGVILRTRTQLRKAAKHLRKVWDTRIYQSARIATAAQRRDAQLLEQKIDALWPGSDTGRK